MKTKNKRATWIPFYAVMFLLSLFYTSSQFFRSIERDRPMDFVLVLHTLLLGVILILNWRREHNEAP